jgi:hypothetical protein
VVVNGRTENRVDQATRHSIGYAGSGVGCSGSLGSALPADSSNYFKLQQYPAVSYRDKTRATAM